MPLTSIIVLSYNKSLKRGKVTNSSWFAGDFPILALKIHVPKITLVSGKPKWLVSLERRLILTHLLNKEFNSVYCSFFFFFQKWKKKPNMQFLILTPFYKLFLMAYHLLIEHQASWRETKDILRIVTKCILGYINKRVDTVIKHTWNLVWPIITRCMETFILNQRKTHLLFKMSNWSLFLIFLLDIEWHFHEHSFLV